MEPRELYEFVGSNGWHYYRENILAKSAGVLRRDDIFIFLGTKEIQDLSGLKPAYFFLFKGEIFMIINITNWHFKKIS